MSRLATEVGGFRVQRTTEGAAHQIDYVLRTGPYALTPTEERYVLAERMTPYVYTIPRLLRIQGPLDARRFAQALENVVSRHAALRTDFVQDRTGQNWKYILQDLPPNLVQIDMPDADLDQVNAYLRPVLLAKPDLRADSLSRYYLIRTKSDLFYFCMSYHHSISDGQSAGILLDEIFAAYRAEDLPRAGPAPHEIFEENWASSNLYSHQMKWWQTYLQEAPTQADLPADIEWTKGPAMAALDHSLSPKTISTILELSNRLKISEFSVYYAMTLILLSRLSGNDDVLTAFQSNGRRAYPQAARSVGGFSNALIFRSPINWDGNFEEFACEVAKNLKACVANEFVPYHHVISKTGVHPRFGVNWFPSQSDRWLVPGLDIMDASHDLRESDYQLNFRFLRHVDTRRMLVFYRAQELSAARIKMLAQQFEDLVRQIGQDPVASLAAVRLLGPRHSQKSWPLPLRQGLLEGFMARVQDQPDHPAIQADGWALTYQELARIAAGTAKQLQNLPQAKPIAILAERCPQLVIALLSALMRGHSFVVLDPAYPDARLLQMLSQVRPCAVWIHGKDLVGRGKKLAENSGAVSLIFDLGKPCDVGLLTSRPDDPAYYLFTSGTTGQPKGVVVSHLPLVNFVDWQIHRFGIGPTDRVSMLSGLGHDPLMRDIFTPLSAGACLVIPQQSQILQPGGLAGWVQQVKPTICHLTPQMGELMLAGSTFGALSGLRLMFWGGDRLRPHLIERFRNVAPDAQHVNFYGATETPQAAAFYPVPKIDALERGHAVHPPAFPIGYSTAHYDALVEAKSGVAGWFEPAEIVVHTDLPPIGLLGKDEQPAQATVHRTGDMGFYQADGAIQLVGRRDDQVKVRGYRIELAEISQTFERHPYVHQAIILPTDYEGQTRLTAFIVSSINDAELTSSLRPYLHEHLPAYMVPETIIPITAIPLTPNGKPDRAKLQFIAQSSVDHIRRSEPKSGHILVGAEKELAAKWGRILGIKEIGPHDSLLTLGGDSLSFVNLYLATEELLGTVPEGWQSMTIRELVGGEAEPVKQSGFWRMIDSAMLTRAVAISLIVSSHLKFIPYFSGATSALFMVAGFLLASLQLPTAIAERSIRPVGRMMANLLVPVMAFSVLLYLGHALTGRDPHISMLTMTANWYDYSSGPRDGRPLYMWYIHCMMQMLVVFAGILWWRLKSEKPLDIFSFLCVLFTAGIVVRYGALLSLEPRFLSDGIAPLSIWSYLPTTHFPTLILGGMLATVPRTSARYVLLGILLIYGLSLQGSSDGYPGIYVILFGTMLLFVRRLPMPRFVSHILFPLSGASLFIYLTHFQFRTALEAVGVMQPWAHVLMALVGGVVLWRLYGWIYGWVVARIRPNQSRSAQIESMI